MLKHVITMYEVFFAPLMPLMLNFWCFVCFSVGGVQRAREKEALCKEVRKFQI